MAKETRKSAPKTVGRKTVGRKTAARKPAARKGPTTKPTATKRVKSAGARAPASIQGWPTDPMGGVPPLTLTAPALPGSKLATRIIDPAQAPAAQAHPLGSAGFRYWTAAEALRRGAAFWADAGANAWHSDVGATLPVRLDDGVDLNAYYARNDFPQEDIKQGLSFFHDAVVDVASGRQITVFSAESPDVVSHELGHAILDTLKPALFDLASTEGAAFHESFGDMSAILVALQLPFVRQAVLRETSGNLRRNSSVSRVAEQLGFAIRQRNPAAVDRDSLRNAANAFRYVDPLTLPPTGPASQLTRAPHNFSRVFTGAFLETLAGMVLELASSPRVEDVEQASVDMGRLLARAIAAAPISTQFFPSVSEQMVLADSTLFGGKYAEALTTAFVRRGLMSIRSLAAPDAVAAAPSRAAAAAARFSAQTAGRAASSDADSDTPSKVAIDGATLGLAVRTVVVSAPPIEDGAPVLPMGGVAARGSEGVSHRADVQAFVEALIVGGRVSIEAKGARQGGLAASLSRSRKHATHYLHKEANDSVELKRIAFECW